MEGFVNENIILCCRLDDGLTTLYPQAKVYNIDGTLVTSKDLTHTNDGYYQNGTWSAPSSGHFTINYTIYTDIGRSIVSPNYNLCVENVFITDSIALSSQINGISSQLYNISSALPLGLWHGTGDWSSTSTTDLSAILEELDFISSQLFWNSGVTFKISTQLTGVSSQVKGLESYGLLYWSSQKLMFADAVWDELSTGHLDVDKAGEQLWTKMNWISSATFGISTQIKYNPPGAGATAAQVWEYTTRELTTVSSSDETTYISSQIGYVSSQLRGISSQIEIYGGGGGGGRYSPKSYIAYTSKQSPWKYREKEDILKNVKAILESVGEIEKKAEKYHNETSKDILKSEKTIVDNINQSILRLNNLKKALEDSSNNVIIGSTERDIKLLNSVDTSIQHLTIYKANIEDKFNQLEICLSDILSLLGTIVPLDKIEELERLDDNEK